MTILWKNGGDEASETLQTSILAEILLAYIDVHVCMSIYFYKWRQITFKKC